MHVKLYMTNTVFPDVPGKFSFIQPFQGILMHSGLYVGILESFAALHMCVYASNMSV